MGRLIDQIHGPWPRAHRLFITWCLRIGVFAFSGLLAFLLRFDLSVPPRYIGPLGTSVVIWIAVKSLVFRSLRLDVGIWKYVSIHDLLILALGNGVASAIGSILIALLTGPGYPRSIYFLDFLACLSCTAGMRIVVRLFADMDAVGNSTGPRKDVLIYGAGAAGAMLLTEIRSNPATGYHARGFIDDDPQKRKTRILGLPVLCSGANLVLFKGSLPAQQVLIAVPSASGAAMTRILNNCQEAGLRCKTIPSLAEVIEGSMRPTAIRDVAVEDLLGRKPNRLETAGILRTLEGQVVMVTGAAGSIGSELCRQIARYRPAAIVAYEISETALFFLEREMRDAYPGIDFYAEIGSIGSKSRLSAVMQRFRPSVIYHAAAYKHVPMMEAHIVEAVENNVLGTYNVLEAASRWQVRDFVMISSDKAVRPTNIMGATKRTAELLVKSFPDGPKCVSVRFGNVLGSSGSVIPIFKQQIAAGGPVRVTHPDVRRFFMTIPEAAQLVLQASTMGTGGEIFVLDMGDSIRIVDLARNLIALSGLSAEKDLRIEFTGLRPGEKLYEEISTLEEETIRSAHEKIKVFVGPGVPSAEMLRHVEEIRSMVAHREGSALLIKLKELVPEYNPSVHVLKQFVPDLPVACETSAGSLHNLAKALEPTDVANSPAFEFEQKSA